MPGVPLKVTNVSFEDDGMIFHASRHWQVIVCIWLKAEGGVNGTLALPLRRCRHLSQSHVAGILLTALLCCSFTEAMLPGLLYI